MKIVRSVATASAAIAIAGGAFLATPAGAAQSGVEAGILTCERVPGSGINLIIHSTADVKCTFKNSEGKVERYKGETGVALGVDLEWKTEEKIAFTVISADKDVMPGSYALAGKYFGGKASVAAGLGAGAQSLIGGSGDNVALQPLALSASKGVGVAAGIGYLYLEPEK